MCTPGEVKQTCWCKEKKKEVLPRLELGSLDSKSKVLTITPQDQAYLSAVHIAIRTIPQGSEYRQYTPRLFESRIVVA